MSLKAEAPADSELLMNDLGPLAWVLDELRKSLDFSNKALRRFARDVEQARGTELTELDNGPLRSARQHLHQAVGALEMVGLPVQAGVLRGMEAVVQKFVQRPDLCSETAAVALDRAGLALTEYLEGMLKGKTASAVALFPQYRAVLEIGAAERIHPADLWPQPWRWLPVALPATVAPLPYVPEVRSRMDRSVLNIVKTGDQQSALLMSRLCLGLAAAQNSPNPHTFWAIAAGYFEAIAQALVPLDIYTRRTASRVLQQYAGLAKGEHAPSERLAQDLAFFCWQARPAQERSAPALQAVLQAYGFKPHAPVNYELEQFGRFDPALLTLARKRIAAAAETWSALAGGDANRIKVVGEQFAAVGESITKLHPESMVLAKALQTAIDGVVRSAAAPSAAIAMEVATAILYLESAYDDLDPTDNHLAERGARLAQRLEQVCSGAEPEPLEGWMEELYRRVSERQTMGSVVDELRGSLAEVEQSLDQFFRNPTDISPLRDVPGRLAQMRGVFSVLGMDQPSLAALRMRSSVERLLVDAPKDPAESTTLFEKLGNSLGAMGLLIDMLSYQRAMAKKLFVYDEAAGEFKPLMGRERSPQNADAASESLSRPAPLSQPAALSQQDSPSQPAPLSRPAPLSQPAPLSPPAPRSAAATRALLASAAQAPEDDESEEELLDIFLEEARDVVVKGLAAVHELVADPANLAEQTTLRRAFHTLKGSSRMVGLNEFGEAAWSFEQMLNAWLAEQKPAGDALIKLSSQGMQAFGRWIEDIAGHRADHWNAADFRKSADAMRLHGEMLPLSPELAGGAAPGAAPPAAEPGPAPAPAVAVAPPAAAPSAVPAPVTLAQSDAEPRAAPPGLAAPAHADFAETQVGHDEPDAAAVAHADFQPSGQREFLPTQALEEEAPASAAPAEGYPELADLDFSVPVAPAAGVGAPASEPVPDSEAAEADNFEMPLTLEFPEADPLEDAVLAPHPQAEPVPAAAPVVASAPEVPLQEPEGEEQVKVIGTLRMSIPLYNVYLNEADEWSRRLQTELTEWALELPRPVPDSSVALAHSLGGSSGTVGFLALARQARLLEHALEHVQLHNQGNAAFAKVFCDSAEDIRRLLHQFAAGFLKESDEKVLRALQAIVDTDFLESAEVLAVPQAAPPPPPPPPPPPSPRHTADAPGLPPAGARKLAAAPLRMAGGKDDELDAQDRLDPDLFAFFQEEAVELLPALGTALRQWIDDPERAPARAEVLRVLHTLKGSSRLAGAMRLGEMAHRMESSIEELGSDGLQTVQLEPLLARFDALQATFEALSEHPDIAAQDVADAPGVPEPALAAAREVTEVETVPPAAARVAGTPPAPRPPGPEHSAAKAPAAPPVRALSGQSVRVRSQLLDRLVNLAGEVMISRSRLEGRNTQLVGTLDDLNGNLDRLRGQLRDIELQAESQMQSRMAQTKDMASAFDPLEFDRFTRVQELTRMMAESVNDVATVQRNLRRIADGTEDDLVAQGRQARELQRDLLRTRMVEFDAVSDRLYGVVRQAAKEAGKQVRLDIHGGSFEMDRGVLDRMTPAFEHILRNGVAHGIEPVEERVAAGKPPSGTITIQVNQQGNDVSVAFHDDGGGLKLEKIRAKAIASKLIGPDEALSDEAAAHLLFMPGFSTADKVTELSGRGIGMDVVMSELNAIGGRVETSTVVGKGTTFNLVLPLTTAVTQVVMLRAGTFVFGVPSNLMETVLRMPAAPVMAAYRNGLFPFGGLDVPFFWAGALLQLSGRTSESESKSLPVAVFRSAGQHVVLHVDEVLGNREVVVKNLGPQLARLPGLTGMSVLASGAVVLIYNPVALATVYGEQARSLQTLGATEAAAAAAGTAVALAQAEALVPLVLVVDDSITVRRVTQRLLKREGYRVALANDGQDALEKLREEKPDVVLSDIEMPRMDGFELVRHIRSSPDLKDLPVIMITSRIAQKHRDLANELGVDHYLGKPYSEEELLGLIQGYCATEAET